MTKEFETLINNIFVINEASAKSPDLVEVHIEIMDSTRFCIWVFENNSVKDRGIITSMNGDFDKVEEAINFVKDYYTEALDFLKFSNAMSIVRESVDFALSCDISKEIWEKAFKEGLKAFEEIKEAE